MAGGDVGPQLERPTRRKIWPSHPDSTGEGNPAAYRSSEPRANRVVYVQQWEHALDAARCRGPGERMSRNVWERPYRPSPKRIVVAVLWPMGRDRKDVLVRRYRTLRAEGSHQRAAQNGECRAVRCKHSTGSNMTPLPANPR